MEFRGPNLRGGGEVGEGVASQGKCWKKKQNEGFDDFIAAAEYLNCGTIAAQKPAIEGASNGGLLVGRDAMQRPEPVPGGGCAPDPSWKMRRLQKLWRADWVAETGSGKR